MGKKQEETLQLAAIVLVEDQTGGQKRHRQVTVAKGEPLPSNLVAGERERLKAAGVFSGKPPTGQRPQHTRASVGAPNTDATIGDASGTYPGDENRPETPRVVAPPPGSAVQIDADKLRSVHSDTPQEKALRQEQEQGRQNPDVAGTPGQAPPDPQEDTSGKGTGSKSGGSKGGSKSTAKKNTAKK